MRHKLIIFLFLLPLVLRAQNIVEVIEKHPFPIGYVAISHAHEMAFDKSGLMWIAVQINGAGILQYDGFDWSSIAATPHNHDDDEDDDDIHGLASDHNACIKIDEKGRVWVGSAGHGLSRLADTTWKTFTTHSNLGHGVVRDILLVKDTAWIATKNGLSKIVNDTVVKTYRSADGLPDAATTCLCLDASGRLWVGTERGVACFDGTNFFKYYPVTGPLTDNYIDALVMDRENNIWAAIYNSGIYKFDGTKWNLIFSEHTNFSSLAIDFRGRLWAGSRISGAYLYNGNTWKHYSLNDGLYNQQVLSIATDVKGAVWLGAFGGLTKIYDTISKPIDMASLELENNIVIYPNPVSSTLSLENVKDASIQIFNSIGQILIHKQSDNETAHIDMTKFPVGVYFLKITNRNNQTTVKKVVKK